MGLSVHPFESAGESSPCVTDFAGVFFARGDVSDARAQLARYKEASKEHRKCAADAWQRGIASIPFEENMSYLQCPSESSVLSMVSRTTCEAQGKDGSWLDIPRLNEVVICIPTGRRTLFLEQDGFLRAFDMSTVLWPAGFFLTLWASQNCQLLGGRVLELGAGIGGPSIAASLCGGNSVVATEKNIYALVNIKTNSCINRASVHTRLLDWDNRSHIDALAEQSFDVILGAGLAPHRWTSQHWNMLSQLLHSKTGRVVLAYGVGDITFNGSIVGDGTFIREQTVMGDTYDLQTRWGTPSEFEISVLRRARTSEL